MVDRPDAVGTRPKNSALPAGVDTDPVERVQEWLSAQGIAMPARAESSPRPPARAESPRRPPARQRTRVARPVPGDGDVRSAAGSVFGPAPGGGDLESDTGVASEPDVSLGAAPNPGPAPAPDPGPDADPEAVARAIVLRKLAVRACTRQELERVLAKRSVPPEVAAVVLDRMEEVRLVDDAVFAADWVASRQQRRHLSVGALRRELSARGVAREQVSEAVAGVDEEDEYAAALDLAQRRAPSLARYPSEVRYRRLAGVLGRRGFGSAITTRVLRDVLRTDD